MHFVHFAVPLSLSSLDCDIYLSRSFCSVCRMFVLSTSSLNRSIKNIFYCVRLWPRWTHTTKNRIRTTVDCSFGWWNSAQELFNRNRCLMFLFSLFSLIWFSLTLFLNSFRFGPILYLFCHCTYTLSDHRLRKFTTQWWRNDMASSTHTHSCVRHS